MARRIRGGVLTSNRSFSPTEIVRYEGIRFARRMMVIGALVGFALGVFAGWLFL